MRGGTSVRLPVMAARRPRVSAAGARGFVPSGRRRGRRRRLLGADAYGVASAGEAFAFVDRRHGNGVAGTNGVGGLIGAARLNAVAQANGARRQGGFAGDLPRFRAHEAALGHLRPGFGQFRIVQAAQQRRPLESPNTDGAVCPAGGETPAVGADAHRRKGGAKYWPHDFIDYLASRQSQKPQNATRIDNSQIASWRHGFDYHHATLG